ncbi:MAG: hypothetical protein U5L45_23095 [Saprospiraceae bacterium]|nr:hypothetical protein [Saprospiraceae bacterium]
MLFKLSKTPPSVFGRISTFQLPCRQIVIQPNYLSTRFLLAQRQEKRWFIFRLCEKSTTFPFLRERSECVVKSYDSTNIFKLHP